jgi:transposase
MRNVALDLGVREISYCEVLQGKVVCRRTVRELEQLKDLLAKGEPATVAIEACREAWHVHETLTAWGNTVLLVDTTRARRVGVGEHGRKNDRIDAEHYARAVERGGIPLAHLLSPERRELRELLAVRRALVETRAQYITTIRGLVRARGEKLPSCDSEEFVRNLRATQLDPKTRAMFAPVENALAVIDEQVARADVALDEVCGKEAMVRRLATAPGVGLIVAAAFVSVIDEAKRFNNAHQVESYLGLVPSEETTGGRNRRRLGAITKNGNPYTRTLLIQAAWAILRRCDPDDPLARWGHAVVKRRGNRIGVVALARRLAGILWAMWRHNTVYESERVGRGSANGLEKHAQSLAVEAAAMKRAADKEQRRRRDTVGKLKTASKEVHASV